MRLSARLPLALALVTVAAVSAWAGWGVLSPTVATGETGAAAQIQATFGDPGEVHLCNALITAPGPGTPPLDPGPSRVDCQPCWLQCGGAKCTLDCYPCTCDPRCPD